MTKQEFENWVISKGYSKDEAGNYQITLDNGAVARFEMQPNSVRYEKQVQNEWIKLARGSYKNLSITPEGKLAGMKR